MKKRIKTKNFIPPSAETNRVIREINQLVRKMSKEYLQYSKDTTSEILDYLTQKYDAIFNAKSQDWAGRIADSALKSADTQFASSLLDMSSQFSIGKPELTDSMRNSLKLITKENSDLFKTIPKRFHSNVSTVAYNAITSGKGAYDISRYIKKFDNGTRNYVQLRTMDQTRKAFSSLSRQRMVDAGIKKFEWVHTGGTEEPRKLHLALNGKVFDIDDPPYIGDMYGQRIHGFPSQLPNCRCRQRFVIADA